MACETTNSKRGRPLADIPFAGHVSPGATAFISTERKAKRAAYMKVWRKAHKAEIAAYKAAYRESHRAEMIAYRQARKAKRAAYGVAYRKTHKAKRAAYRQAHKAEIAASVAMYQKNHKAKMAAYHVTWYKAHKADILAYHVAYYKTHPDYYREQGAKRRAMKAGATVERVYRAIVFERDQGRCHLCGKKVNPKKWHLDHIIPLARGGEHSCQNVAVSCAKCNLSKGIKAGAQLRLY